MNQTESLSSCSLHSGKGKMENKHDSGNDSETNNKDDMTVTGEKSITLVRDHLTCWGQKGLAKMWCGVELEERKFQRAEPNQRP